MPGAAVRSTVHRVLVGGPDARRPLLVLDAVLAVILAGALLYSNTRPEGSSVGAAAGAVRSAGTLVAASAVAVRRLDARWAFTAATVGASLASALGGAPMVSVCIAITAYSAATAGEYRLWWAPPAAASAMIAGAVATGDVHSWLAALIASVAVVCVGWLAGQAARERRNRILAAAEQRAGRERQHAADLRQAAVDERLVIARELHDIVAHSMSVIAVRAGVARVVMDHDPAEVKEALGIIETTTRQALHEMRLLVAVLREQEPGSSALAPTPGLADLEALADQVRQAGVDLRVDVRGPARPLPPGVDLSAYRIAQEALTNVVRHAGPTSATLRIEYRPDDVLIDVTDDGLAATVEPASTDLARTDLAPAGTGHGLIGMSERVALFDGRLRAGRLGPGFQVNAVLRTGGPGS